VPSQVWGGHSSAWLIGFVVLVVIVLSAAVVAFAVKNLKLRRSFIAFANSHYNSRSGAATISTSDGLGKKLKLMTLGTLIH
jgi:hypothetical protein